jgi:predicted DNA-binding protein (MmcQ/YjbR family)
MNIDSIRAYCLNFPRATEKLQWGDDLCFKVAGKIFTILGLDNPRLCFKCNPEVFAELIEREDIRPAPSAVTNGDAPPSDTVSDSELKDLIPQSYNMIAPKAPKQSKPKPRKTTKSKSPRKKKSAKTLTKAKPRKRRQAS